MTLMQQPAPRAHDERAAGYSARNDGEYRAIPRARIVRSGYNPRADFAEAYIAELAASLKEHGQLQPIVVRPLPAATEGDAPRFELIIGECRWRAAAIADLDTLSCHVVTVDTATAMRWAMLENLKRKDLTPIEEARGYARLRDELGVTQERIAGEMGKKQPDVAKALGLLQLPEAVQEMIADGTLRPGHGVALGRFKAWPKACTIIAKWAARTNTTTKRLESNEILSDYNLIQDLTNGQAARRIGMALFDRDTCTACPFKARFPGDVHGGLCFKPEHFDELTAAERARRAATAAVAVSALTSGAGPATTRPIATTEPAPASDTPQATPGKIGPRHTMAGPILCQQCDVEIAGDQGMTYYKGRFMHETCRAGIVDAPATEGPEPATTDVLDPDQGHAHDAMDEPASVVPGEPVVEPLATLDERLRRIDRGELAIHRYYVLTMAEALPEIDATLFDAAAARLRLPVRYGHLAGLTGARLWDRLYALGINNLVHVLGEALVRRDDAQGRDDAGDMAEWVTTGRITPRLVDTLGRE